MQEPMAEAAVEQASAAPASTPAQAPKAEASSLQPPTQDFNARLAAAKTPADVRRLTEENRAAMEAAVDKARKDPKADKASAPEMPPDLKAAAEAEAQQKAQEEAAPPAEDGTTPAEQPEEVAAPETPAADDDEDGDTPLEPVGTDRVRLRFSETDKVGRLAASLLKRNRDLTMEEAVGRAKQQLGIKDPAATPEAPQSTLPQTVDAVDAEIKNLRAQRKKANTDLNFEAASDLNDKIEDLLLHRGKIERDAQRAESEQAASYDRQFDAAVAKAADLYPDSANAESEFGKRMLEIERDLKANGDPLYNSPTKALKIAQMVAAEKNIAPRKKGAPVVPAKPAVPPVAAPKKQVLPAGGSRTVAPVVPAKPAIDSEISGVKSIKDLRDVQRKLGIGGFNVGVGR